MSALLEEMPGYPETLKAVIQNQMQLLMEQLYDQTGEESVLMTVSVTEGTLCHLGSQAGKDFIQDHQDFKSKFLDFCLKTYQKRKSSKLAVDNVQTYIKQEPDEDVAITGIDIGNMTESRTDTDNNNNNQSPPGNKNRKRKSSSDIIIKEKPEHGSRADQSTSGHSSGKSKKTAADLAIKPVIHFPNVSDAQMTLGRPVTMNVDPDNADTLVQDCNGKEIKDIAETYGQNGNGALPIIKIKSRTPRKAFADHIAKLVQGKFADLTDDQKSPYAQHKVLSGMVMTRSKDLADSKVLCVTTGTKCIMGNI